MALLGKIKALIRLMRPELPIAAGACVVVGQALGLGSLPDARVMALGFLLGFCLSGSQMVFNDLFDLEVDRVNAPQRPLPSGLLAPAEVIAFGVVLALIALAAAWSFGPGAFALALAAWVLGFLYNWKLKAAGLWGNLIVSASVSATILMGGLSVHRAGSPMVWIFALITGAFDLAEEIAGDAMDMEGDRKRGSRSLAIVRGRAAALRVSAGLFGLVVLLTALPLAYGITGAGYLVPIAVMDVVIIIFTARLLASRTPQEGRRAMRVMYLSASLGLVAFVIATFWA